MRHTAQMSLRSLVRQRQSARGVTHYILKESNFGELVSRANGFVSCAAAFVMIIAWLI